MMARMHGRHDGFLADQWGWQAAVVFATAVCGFGLVVSSLGSFGPQLNLSVPKLHLAIGSTLGLAIVAALLPAIFCLVFFVRARESLKQVNAPWDVYLLAIGLGFAIPFMSYFGSHYASFPWSYASRITLGRVFVLNLLLSPLWEEIIWRGCFLNKLTTFISRPKAIAVSSVAWTFWHGGYLTFLYSRGIPGRLLFVLSLTYFCAGIILGSVFEMGRESLWPCVFMHAAFNASTAVYYTSYDRASELSSYVAEFVAALVVAGLLFKFTIARLRSGRLSGPEMSAAWP